MKNCHSNEQISLFCPHASCGVFVSSHRDRTDRNSCHIVHRLGFILGLRLQTYVCVWQESSDQQKERAEKLWMQILNEMEKHIEMNTFPNTLYQTKMVSVCMYVFLSITSTTIHPIDFAFGGCIAEEPKKCSVGCEVVCMNGSRERCMQQYRRPSNRPAPSRHIFNQYYIASCPCFVTCSSATNNYFCYWLIYWLFSQLIIILSNNCQEIVKHVHHVCRA